MREYKVKRDVKIDFLRGMAMLLVVMGHATAHYDNLLIPYNIIYSFHMPLLFFLSGYINEKKCRSMVSFSFGHYILRKMNSLILPYVSWSLISYIVRRREFFFKEFLYRIMGIDGASELWFFPVLFGISIIFGLDVFIRNKNTEVLSVVILVWMYLGLICVAYSTKYVYAVNMISYFLAFYAGVSIVRCKSIFKASRNGVLLISLAIAYVALFSIFDFRNTSWTTQVIRIVMGICISIELMHFTEKIHCYNTLLKAASFFGKYSLAIYVMHNYLNRWYIIIDEAGNPFVAFVVVLLCSVCVCLLCAAIGKILSTIPLVNVLFMGNIPVKKRTKVLNYNDA